MGRKRRGRNHSRGKGKQMKGRRNIPISFLDLVLRSLGLNAQGVIKFRLSYHGCELVASGVSEVCVALVVQLRCIVFTSWLCSRSTL